MPLLPYSRVASYLHGNGKVGAMVQVACNDGHTAEMSEFKDFAHELALHIAACKPTCIYSNELNPELIEQALSKLSGSISSLPPAERKDRLAQAREQVVKQHCLLEQPFVKNPGHSVGELVQELAAKLKVNIRVVRFVVYSTDET